MIRFNRNELAGAFGDMGTDVPLIVGMVLAAGLDGASVLIMFGALQVVSGLIYRMPMPVQPLKAMAALVIAQQATAGMLYGAGLAIGIVMLLLAITGGLDLLARWIPRSVVRGIQLGLGLQLGLVALRQFIPADGLPGYVLAAGAFVVTILLLGNRRFPAALPVVALGLVYAVLFNMDASLGGHFGLHLPVVHVPSWTDIMAGFVVLALPQIPLSLGNSVLATHQLSEDLFPGRGVSVRRIGITYGIMNLINPWFGGIPTCHGSGGMAGHYTFGGRTGGSIVLYGAVFLVTGLFFGSGFDLAAEAFPLPMLGVILFFEALALMWLIRDVAPLRAEFPVTLLVGIISVGLPYGYVIGLLVGTVLVYLGRRIQLVQGP